MINSYGYNTAVLQQHSTAWFAVVNALNAAAPDWQENEGTGLQCAVLAIDKLAQTNVPNAVLDEMSMLKWWMREVLRSGKYISPVMRNEGERLLSVKTT